jgi:hypothetical protein
MDLNKCLLFKCYKNWNFDRFLDSAKQSLKPDFTLVHPPTHQIQVSGRPTILKLNYLDTSLKPIF